MYGVMKHRLKRLRPACDLHEDCTKPCPIEAEVWAEIAKLERGQVTRSTREKLSAAGSKRAEQDVCRPLVQRRVS